HADPPTASWLYVPAVSAADVHGATRQRHDRDDNRLSIPGPHRQPRRRRMAGARGIADLDRRPPQLLDRAVGPHPDGVVQRAVPGGLLLHDHDKREVLEP